MPPTPNIAFALAFVTLLGTPVIAPIAAWYVSRQSAVVQRRCFLVLAFVGCSVLLAALLGVSTRWVNANFLLGCLAFLCIAVLAISTFRIRPKFIGMALGALSGIALCFSLLLGTVGALGVLFVVGDLAPIYVSSLSPNRYCFVMSFGNATTATGGYDVTIKYVPSLFPIVAFTRSRSRFESPSFLPPEACLHAQGAPG